jgi:hypothetical protein
MKKNSSTFAIFLLIVTCILITACQNIGLSIESGECDAPCWRGIQPSVSTYEDMIDTVDSFHDIKSDEVWKGGDSKSSDKAIAFELSDGINVTIYTMDEIVALILFSKVDGIISFENCMQEFGEPEFVVQSSVMGFGPPLGATSAWHTWFYAVNSKRGIVYGYDTYSYFGKKSIITPQTRVTEIKYFNAISLDTLLSEGLLVKEEISKDVSINTLHPWAGYGDIDVLYPEK